MHNKMQQWVIPLVPNGDSVTASQDIKECQVKNVDEEFCDIVNSNNPTNNEPRGFILDDSRPVSPTKASDFTYAIDKDTYIQMEDGLTLQPRTTAWLLCIKQMAP